MEPSQIERVRSFNRLVTVRVGALDDSYLGRRRPLGQARLLFEIGGAGDCDLRRMRERLGLDSGYVSRLLRALSTQGLVTVESDPADRRRRLVRLTAKGKAEHAAYDALSDTLARSFLAPLTAPQRARLTAAMKEVGMLLTAASVKVGIEPEDCEDAVRCVEAYFRELDERFEGGFDPNAGGYSAGRKADARDCFMIARLDGRAIGCGAFKVLDDATGEIKRMWVAPEARGLGLAHRLLAALEAHALRSGIRRIRLDTNRALAQAQALYRGAGYREIARYNDNSYAHFWFEKELDGAVDG